MEGKLRRTAGKKRVYRQQAALGWLYSAVIAAAVLAFVFGVWLMPLRVAGESMEPALGNNDAVLIDKLNKYWRLPTRGDIILFRDDAGVHCLKRVIGLPGERVEIVNGQVFIDSCPLDESAYVLSPTGDQDMLIVPGNCVYVLGDNRAFVYDSRLESVGCVAYDEIIGALRLKIYPAREMMLYY